MFILKTREFNIKKGAFKGAPENDDKEFDYVCNEWMLRTERRALLKYLGLSGGFVIVSICFAFIPGVEPLYQIAFIIGALLLPFHMAKQIITFIGNKRRMLSAIRVKGDRIWINDEEINFYHIQKVQITDINVNPSGAFIATQRYLNIYLNMEKKKYWLGSHLSVHNDDYIALCDFLEDCFK